jgi:hypothetical protein
MSAMLGGLQGELRLDAADDVAQVGHAFLEVLVLDLSEEGGVLFERLVQGAVRVEMAVEDGGLDLAEQRRIAQQQTMRLKDGCFLVADLLVDAGNDRVQLEGGGGAGVVETTDLPRQGRRVEFARRALGQHLIDAVGPCDGDSRRDRHASLHGNSLIAASARHVGDGYSPVFRQRKPEVINSHSPVFLPDREMSRKRRAGLAFRAELRTSGQATAPLAASAASSG